MNNNQDTTIDNNMNISLNNTKLYLNSFNKESCFEKYIDLITQYIIYITTNQDLNQKGNQIYYVFIKGIELLNNIYCIILLYTKNLDMAYYNVQKSYYLFIEFISQIEQLQLKNLKLTCNDAIFFVYKKTIYNIDYEHKSKLEFTNNNEYNVFKNNINMISSIIIQFVEENKMFENKENTIILQKKLKKILKTIKNKKNYEIQELLQNISF